MARDAEPNVAQDVQVGPAPHERLYDYYVAPQRVEPSPLHDLANALAPLSNDLFNLAGQQKAVQNKTDAAQADTDFWDQNSSGANKAVQDGTLPADKSPAYMNAYGANAGLNDALRFQQSVGPHYQGLDKTTNDPEAFDKWFFPLAKDNSNPAMNKNPGYAKAYGQGIARLHAELSGRYVTDRSEAIKTGAQQEFTAAIGNQINVMWPTGSSDMDSVAMAGALDQIRQKAISSGMDPAFVEKSIVDVVHTKALDHKSPAVLGVLGQMAHDPNDPTSAKIGETEYGSAKTLETRATIQTLLIQDRERQRAVIKQADEDGYKQAVVPMLAQWASGNKNFAPSAGQIALASRHDPLFLSKLSEYRKNVLANNTAEDPEAKADLFRDLLASGGGQKLVMDAIGHGVLKTPESIKSASEYGNLVENYNKSGGAFKITEDPTFKRYVAVIESSTKDPKWVQSVTGGTGVTLDGRRAVNVLTEAAMQAQLAHPEWGPIERQKFLSSLGETIMGGFTGPDGKPASEATTFSQHKFTPPVGLGAPQSPSAPQGAAPTAPQAPPQPTPQNNAPGGSPAAPANGLKERLGALPVAPSVTDLSPTEQAFVGQVATQAKMTPQAVLTEMWARSKAGGTTSPPATAATPGKRSALDDQGTVQTADATGAAMSATPVSFNIPGGGRVEMHGVDPQVSEQVQHMVAQMARLAPGGDAATKPGAPQQKAAGASEAVEGGVNPSRVAQMDASPHKALIEKVAKDTGMDPSRLKAMVSIESGGRENVDTGSYKGLLQLSKAEFDRYGKGGDIHDPEDNLRAGVASLQAKEAKFTTQFGRKPSATELYLMHQQGEGGLRAHEANPEGLAWENMAGTREGQQKGDRWAKQAIWGNVPNDMKAQIGSVENMTSAQFMAVWAHKLEGTPYKTALARIKSRGELAQN